MGSDSTAKASATATASTWKLAHGINLHKLLVIPVTAALMWSYSCFTPAAWTYLALHGSYGLLWVAKDITFPDRNFQEHCSFGKMLFIGVMISVYYFPIPWVLVYYARAVPVWYPAVAIALYSFGMFLMMGSDCQKYYTLKAAPGKLITSGFFKYIRSPNYLGELFIYMAFSMLTYSPWGFIPSLLFLLTGVLPNSAKKDSSMSRYPEFADYKARSYRVLPPVF